VFGISLVVSLFIEMIQEFIPSRTSSLYDVVAQTMGTGIGMTAWSLFGTEISGQVRNVFRQPNKAFPFLYTYVAVLFTFQMLYFDFTISLTQLARKYRAGRVTIVPFSEASGSGFFGLVYTAGLMAPVGFLFWMVLQDRRRPVVAALVYSFFVAASIELAQLFVKSRYSTTTDVVMGCVGAMIGIAIARTLQRLTTKASTAPFTETFR
jgi:glycopeptide antibiotics resistance protein